MADDSIQVQFGAQTGDLEGGVDRVKEQIRGVGDEAQRAEELFKYLAERMAEVFAIHEIADFVEKMADLGEQALRASAMLGMTVEQVQELQYAAKLAGTDSESLTTSMVRFERNIADAQKGAGNAAEAFHNLGISQQELKTSSPTQLLYQVADAFHNTADGAEKVQYAIALGGRAWAQMIPLLDKGGEAIRQAGVEAEKTASVMSHEQAKALEDTKQGLIEAGASWTGAGLAIMNVLGPAIDDLIAGLSVLGKAVTGAIGLFREMQIVIAGEIIIALARLVSSIKEFGSEVEATVANAVTRWQEMGAVMTAVATGHWSLVKDITAEANDNIAASTRRANVAIHEQETAYQNLKTGAIDAMNSILSKQAQLENAPAKSKLPALEGGYGKEDNTEKQLAEEDVRFQEQMGKLELANRKSILDEKVAMGEVSKQEEYAQLQKLNDDEYALEKAALEQAAQVDGLTVVEQQKIDDQLLLLHQKYLNQRQALTTKSVDEEKKQYDQLFQGINHAFTTSINGILQGTQTWQQATARIVTGILSVFVDMAEKIAAKWLETTLLNAIYGKAEATTNIAGDAATAGAAAYASTAAIPVVGPALAPAAAAQAYGSTMAFQGLLPLETGAWEIPGTMPALLHPGEMVVPQTFAQSLRDSGTLGGGGGTTININAIDTQTGAQFLKNNARAIAQAISGQARNFNPALKPAAQAMSTSVFPTLAGLGWDVTRTPRWKSIVQENISGKETRVAEWTYPRWQWDLTYDLLRQGTVHGTAYSEFAQLAGFFNARQGQFDSFLYTDADDNAVTAQTIGTGNGTTTAFQLLRTFGNFIEPVLAPNTVSAVYLNGVSLPSTSLSAPATPTYNPVFSGSLAATTYYVKLTYTNGAGESAPSGELVITMGANNVFSIVAPGASTGATGYNVYASNTAGGGSGHETKQNAVPIAVNTAWTEPTSGLISGAACPTTNNSGWSVSNWGTTTPGVLTFGGAPANSVAITADFTYYWPCRFTADDLSFSKFMNALYSNKKVSFLSLKN